MTIRLVYWSFDYKKSRYDDTNEFSIIGLYSETGLGGSIYFVRTIYYSEVSEGQIDYEQIQKSMATPGDGVSVEVPEGRIEFLNDIWFISKSGRFQLKREQYYSEGDIYELMKTMNMKID